MSSGQAWFGGSSEGLSVGMAFGAKALLTYPEVVQQIAPIYTMLFLIGSAWLGTQLGYARAKITGMRAARG
jgi:hypothetical protein